MELTARPHYMDPRAVRLRTDIYPANVAFSFADNPYPRARALVTIDEVIVLVEGGYEVSELYRGLLEDVRGSRTEIVATTSDGDVTITRQGGCGCGSRLKTYRPFARTLAMASS